MIKTLDKPKTIEFASWPIFDANDAAAVAAVILSGKVNYWTGSIGKEFESEFAKYVGTNHALSISNGTVALELALKALGIGVGDEVVVTPRSFMASAASIVGAGATPVFADVDLQSGNITAESIEDVLSNRTKAILLVHIAGWPCDMDPIMNLARSRGLKVIEDCAQAHGAHYKGRSVGSFGDIGAWSFCQDKIISTGGEGGMLTMNDNSLWSKCWSYRDNGKSYEAVNRKDHPNGYRWVYESFGTNARLTEMQSTLGIIGLQKLPCSVLKRSHNAQQLTSAFSQVEALRVEEPRSFETHSYYKYYVYVRPEMLASGWSRDRFIEEITRAGVPCMSGGCSELYRETAFVRAGIQPKNRLPNAKELGETSLMFLVHPTLSSDAVRRTCEVVTKVVSGAIR